MLMPEKIKFTNSAGDQLVGVLHKSNNSNKAVIIAHGFTSNKDRPRHIQLANELEKNGINALRIDFGGSGESCKREITIKAEIDDLLSAIKFLKDKGFKEIGVLGESLGGIVALEAYSPNIKAMVLWAPVTNKAKETHKKLDKEQIKSLNDNGYYIREKDGREFRIPQEYFKERKSVDREKVLGGIKIPVMIVHGTADDAVPIGDSEEAVKMLPKGSKLEVIDNWEHGDHKMDESMDIIIPKTVGWFKDKLQ